MPENLPLNQGWVRWLPLVLRRRMQGRPRLQAVMSNTAWLVGDRLLRIGVGLIVIVWVIRYLGAERFGQLSYAIAFAGLFFPLTTLGLESMVVRELLEHPQETDVILGTTAGLRFGGAVLCLLLILTVAFAVGVRGDTLVLVSLIALGPLFQALDVIDFYNQSQLQSRRTVLARGLAFLLSSLGRIAMILLGAPLIAFALLLVAETTLASIFQILSYRSHGGILRKWRFQEGPARRLLKSSWPLILSGFAIAVYMRIDQLMLHFLTTERVVGIYSAAVKMSELWYFLPTALVNSAFPAILSLGLGRLEERRHKLDRLFQILAGLGLCVALPTAFLSGWLVRRLYGSDFIEAGPILAVHIWTGIPVALGLGKEYWLVAENLTRFSMFATLGGASVNVLLNLCLIPHWGPLGAAWATLCAQIVANQVAPAFHSRTREIFWLQMQGLCIWRLIA